MGQIVVLLGNILGTHWVHVASIHCLSKIPFLTLPFLLKVLQERGQLLGFIITN
jgi:hypothetical protein